MTLSFFRGRILRREKESATRSELAVQQSSIQLVTRIIQSRAALPFRSLRMELTMTGTRAQVPATRPRMLAWYMKLVSRCGFQLRSKATSCCSPRHSGRPACISRLAIGRPSSTA
jgi:hypothetical protein